MPPRSNFETHQLDLPSLPATTSKLSPCFDLAARRTAPTAATNGSTLGFALGFFAGGVFVPSLGFMCPCLLPHLGDAGWDA
jgi:hypothetical protein